MARAADIKAGAAQCVALGRSAVVSGWADGTIRCHSRSATAAVPGGSRCASHAAGPCAAGGGGAAGGALAAQLWSVPDAHRTPAACGVTAIQLSNRCARRLARFCCVWSVCGCASDVSTLTHTAGPATRARCGRGQFVASGGAGGELRVFDAASRELACHLKHHGQRITDLQVRRGSLGGGACGGGQIAQVQTTHGTRARR